MGILSRAPRPNFYEMAPGLALDLVGVINGIYWPKMAILQKKNFFFECPLNYFLNGKAPGSDFFYHLPYLGSALTDMVWDPGSAGVWLLKN